MNNVLVSSGKVIVLFINPMICKAIVVFKQRRFVILLCSKNILLCS